MTWFVQDPDRLAYALVAYICMSSAYIVGTLIGKRIGKRLLG